MALTDAIAKFLGPPADESTTPAPALGSSDPNVDTTGAGESPVAPVDYAPPGYAPRIEKPAPVVNTDPGYIPPGAPKVREANPPTQNLGVATYSIAPGQVVRIAPGSSTPRRITLIAFGSPLHLAPDARQDKTGALLSTAFPTVLRTGAPLFIFNAGPGTSTALSLSVILEPM